MTRRPGGGAVMVSGSMPCPSCGTTGRLSPAASLCAAGLSAAARLCGGPAGLDPLALGRSVLGAWSLVVETIHAHGRNCLQAECRWRAGFRLSLHCNNAGLNTDCTDRGGTAERVEPAQGPPPGLSGGS